MIFRGGKKKVFEHKTCVLIFSTILSEILLILSRINRSAVIRVPTSSCKVLAIRVAFERNLNFLDRFSKNTQIPHFMNISPVGAEFFHADGQT
jgi:hypothetical protein